MSSMRYLTVQDILWINLQVTKKVQHFHFARLEEAVYYQYAYGQSNSLAPQAARFLIGFLKMKPFDAGNEATALIAFATFVRLNGHTLNLKGADAGHWLSSAPMAADPLAGVAALIGLSEAEHGQHEPDVKKLILQTIADFDDVVAAPSA